MKRTAKSEVPSAVLRTTAQLHLTPVKRSSAPALQNPPSSAPLAVAGLFAGVGGIELGLSRSSHEAKVLCEIDEAANTVLEERFHVPASRRFKDVRSISSLPRTVDIVTAGFPCQDLSQAGKTTGIAGTRSGLVEEIFRLLEVRPVEWVLLENVPFMLQLGRGRALDVIITALEHLGYKWAYRVVNSRAFGIPQRRERIFILASQHRDPRNVLLVDEAPEPVDTRTFGDVACGFYWTEGVRGLGWAVDSVPTLKGGSTIGIPSPPAIIFPSGLVAKPDIRDAERMQGFDADWTLGVEAIARRGSRWKLIGNAVTVDVSEWLGRRLRAPGEYDPSGDVEVRARDRWPTCAWNVGNGRYRADVSAWPVHRVAEPLESFLKYPPEPLSSRATSGFLSRARTAKLRFPEGFLAALERHLSNVREADVESSRACLQDVEERIARV